jgi:hypothetical protein
LEAEEALKKQFGTNRKEFYQKFDKPPKQSLHASVLSHSKPLPPDSQCALNSAQTPACGPKRDCDRACSVWLELTTNQAYRKATGFKVPTMTGKKEDLLFTCNQKGESYVVRVWRASGALNFTFGENDCHAICQRFEQGLQADRSFVNGGTAYFNDRSWGRPPLGIIQAPYAAAIIRFARQAVGLPV